MINKSKRLTYILSSLNTPVITEPFDLRDLESLPKLKEIKELGGDEQGTTPSLEGAAPDETSGKDNNQEG